MEQSDLLRFAAAALEKLGLRYLVTGSVATIYYGEPRFTNDIDIVVALPPSRVREFCAAFPAPGFYVSVEAAAAATAAFGPFNILHPASGLKVDLIVASDGASDRCRLGRGRRVSPAPGVEAVFASPEDVIIKKMEYYAGGGSEKHLRDIAGILKISGDMLDRTYIAEWASRLDLAAIWRGVQDRVPQRFRGHRATDSAIRRCNQFLRRKRCHPAAGVTGLAPGALTT